MVHRSLIIDSVGLEHKVSQPTDHANQKPALEPSPKGKLHPGGLWNRLAYHGPHILEMCTDDTRQQQHDRYRQRCNRNVVFWIGFG